jgi:hypothetical protein
MMGKADHEEDKDTVKIAMERTHAPIRRTATPPIPDTERPASARIRRKVQ